MCKNHLQFWIMKNMQLLLFILLASLTTSAQLVVHVYDGDTYRIIRDGKLQVIRLANVDAPELKQYYGTTVRHAVSNLVLGKVVEVLPIKKDWYGRTIARVMVDGQRLDSLLIAKGWAWNYLPYSKYNSALSVYESQAKTAGLGMWKCMHNVPPWVWRQFNKKQKRLNEMCR
jgi:endonuclease YncB( thermonuclease family)